MILNLLIFAYKGVTNVKYNCGLTPATEVKEMLGEDCWGGATFGLCVSDRGREAAAITEATCLLMLEASRGSWLEWDRGGRDSLSASALRPLLWDRRLDGVWGRAPPPVNDLGPGKYNNMN